MTSVTGSPPGNLSYAGESFFITPLINPPYANVYPFECLGINEVRIWMYQNVTFLAIMSAAYVALVFFGPIYMRNRPPYNLKRALLCWNSLLAIFSIMGFIRTVPELLFVLTKPNGLHHSVCTWTDHGQNTAVWMLLFTLSKVAELFDTFFIVARKGKLIFLHYYHHLSVMVYCFLNFPIYEPKFKWFMSINLFIHSVMYTYYSLMTLGFKIPAKYAKLITTAQIAQMVVGVVVNVYLLYVYAIGQPCESNIHSTVQCLIMYASYFYLFFQFYQAAYKTPKIKSK